MTNVGYPLYREVRDYAPADWSSSELVVAWTIADDANDITRISWIYTELLCARARLKPSSVRAALTKLGARGYEFRVPKGYDKNGNPIYATKGYRMDYLIPDMLRAATRPAPELVDNRGNSRQDPGAFDEVKALGIRSKALGNGTKAARILAPLSSDLLSTPQIMAGELTGPVESAPANPTPEPPGVTSGRHHPPGGGRWVSPIERAAWQAAESRRLRNGETE